jgi:hypothetical protein
MIPKGAKIFPLLPGTKIPATSHGYKDAVVYDPENPPVGNYGIVLDNMFVVIDFDCDHPEREAIEKGLPPTWSQRTPRRDCVGMHYMYTIPAGYKGKNTILKGTDGKKIADILFNGYIVGPGSVISDNVYLMIRIVNP